MKGRHLKITVNKITCMLEQLVQMIEPNKAKYSGIIGIAYGGLNVSIPLAMRLRLPHHSVHISCYKGTVKRTLPLLENKKLPANCLVVDDLIDDGTTMALFQEKYGPMDSAVLFLKPGGVATYFVDYKPESWIFFPWEDTCA